MSLDSPAHLLEIFDIRWPIIQAPMAGTGTPALAAAVSNTGGLGSLGVGATNAEGQERRRPSSGLSAVSQRIAMIEAASPSRRHSQRDIDALQLVGLRRSPTR